MLKNKPILYAVLMKDGLLMLSKNKDAFIDTKTGVRVTDPKAILDFSMKEKYAGQQKTGKELMVEFRKKYKDNKIVLL